jgi:hypothetical protein
MDIGESWRQFIQLATKHFGFFHQIAVLVGFSSAGKFFLDLLANTVDHGAVGF